MFYIDRVTFSLIGEFEAFSKMWLIFVKILLPVKRRPTNRFVTVIKFIIMQIASIGSALKIKLNTALRKI